MLAVEWEAAKDLAIGDGAALSKLKAFLNVVHDVVGQLSNPDQSGLKQLLEGSLIAHGAQQGEFGPADNRRNPNTEDEAAVNKFIADFMAKVNETSDATLANGLKERLTIAYSELQTALAAPAPVAVAILPPQVPVGTAAATGGDAIVTQPDPVKLLADAQTELNEKILRSNEAKIKASDAAAALALANVAQVGAVPTLPAFNLTGADVEGATSYTLVRAFGAGKSRSDVLIEKLKNRQTELQSILSQKVRVIEALVDNESTSLKELLQAQADLDLLDKNCRVAYQASLQVARNYCVEKSDVRASDKITSWHNTRGNNESSAEGINAIGLRLSGVIETKKAALLQLKIDAETARDLAVSAVTSQETVVRGLAEAAPRAPEVAVSTSVPFVPVVSPSTATAPVPAADVVTIESPIDDILKTTLYKGLHGQEVAINTDFMNNGLSEAYRKNAEIAIKKLKDLFKGDLATLSSDSDGTGKKRFEDAYIKHVLAVCNEQIAKCKKEHASDKTGTLSNLRDFKNGVYNFFCDKYTEDRVKALIAKTTPQPTETDVKRGDRAVLSKDVSSQLPSQDGAKLDSPVPSQDGVTVSADKFAAFGAFDDSVSFDTILAAIEAVHGAHDVIRVKSDGSAELGFADKSVSKQAGTLDNMLLATKTDTTLVFDAKDKGTHAYVKSASGDAKPTLGASMEQVGQDQMITTKGSGDAAVKGIVALLETAMGESKLLEIKGLAPASTSTTDTKRTEQVGGIIAYLKKHNDVQLKLDGLKSEERSALFLAAKEQTGVEIMRKALKGSSVAVQAEFNQACPVAVTAAVSDTSGMRFGVGSFGAVASGQLTATHVVEEAKQSCDH